MINISFHETERRFLLPHSFCAKTRRMSRIIFRLDVGRLNLIFIKVKFQSLPSENEMYYIHSPHRLKIDSIF